MSIKKLLTLTLSLFFAVTVFAQNRTITGTVRDSNGDPLPGVGIILQGTTRGAMSTVDGTFSLSVPAGAAVLEFSSMGYESQTITVPVGQNSINVTLAEDTMSLEETVVVGYGTQKKVNLTGAVSAVESKELENRSARSLGFMLQGSVPGLTISTAQGRGGLNEDPSINIRGFTSINGGSPLVLIDGAVGNLNRINPNDVESVSVIKDAAAGAVYGARAAYGVILVTTKSGAVSDGEATVRYSGRFGWDSPTTSTDYVTCGYESVVATNAFRYNCMGSNYILYDDEDMAALYERRNDKVEDPSRPWVVERFMNGKNMWRYYGNNDWWHLLYRDDRPTQQHNISLSGGTKKMKYFLSGGYDRRIGIIRQAPDIFNKVYLRSKLDIEVNKYIRLSNNTSYFRTHYNYLGDGSVENTIAYSSAHALPVFPFKNPDGSWLYTPASGILNGSYSVANGRHIVIGMGKHTNFEERAEFANTTELTIKPTKNFTLIGNYTYRTSEFKFSSRSVNIPYRDLPGAAMKYYSTGAGLDDYRERIQSYRWDTANVYGTFEDTFSGHHVTLMGGANYEHYHYKRVGGYGKYMLTEELNDLALIGTDENGEPAVEVEGGQSAYALLGFFGRFNYDYKGRYLLEVSGRYDGTSRFARGHRWGFFPSVSAGWRISEEPFFAPLKNTVNNLKVRASFGTLGNQNVSNYLWAQTISIGKMSDSYNFAPGGLAAKSSSISAPNSDTMTWERSEQYNLGVDAAFLGNKLEITADAFIRDTKDMLTEGVALPALYGADAPQANTADLRTKGYEISIGWRDQFVLGNRPFGYNIRATLSDYVSHITKYDNPNKTFAKDYYVGEEIGEIWGYQVDGLFQSDEEAQEYVQTVDMSYVNKRVPGSKWAGGDPKYIDLDGDGKIGIGENTVDKPGDRKIIGNSTPRYNYGLTFGFDYAGFDFSMFFQGVGKRQYYFPSTNWAFWGLYSQPMLTYLQKGLYESAWTPENKDAYFPRPVAYYAYTSQAPLYYANTRYLQNVRYLRLKNVSVGYSLPQNLTRKVGMDKVRVYFTGENMAYWSPLKKYSVYIDPESVAAKTSGTTYERVWIPWSKTMLFGIDITF